MLEKTDDYFENGENSEIFYYYTYLEKELLQLKKSLGKRLNLFENSPNSLLVEEHLNNNLIPRSSIICLEDIQGDLLSSGSQESRRSLLRLFQV